MSCAVARFAPVEPATIVGPRRAPEARLAISASTKAATRAARSIRPCSASQFGQAAKAIFKEVEGNPPVAVVGLRREAFERLRIDLVDDHVVDQRRKIAGERVGFGRGRGDQRRLALVELEPARVRAADRAAQGLAPGARASPARAGG